MNGLYGRRRSGFWHWRGLESYRLERGAWDDTVIEEGRRFMAGRKEEEESAAITWQRKSEAEEADKVVVAPGVTVGQLRRFRAALLGPSLVPLKRRRLLQ